eukprot:GHRR01024705.1.p1 GENE.GHRR01024705.1~~GHRR01024705.1.p1  ORF type:complete len:146 (-),score=29.74 GHRR01024705.1:1158-1595(-)
MMVILWVSASACDALQTYPYVGKLIGRFYDSTGAATTEMNSVHERAKQGEAIKAARADEEARWPSCNSRWTENEGGVVWCDHDMHPRKLFVSMKGGKASWRCACFKELGWSDVRKVGLILFRGTCCNKQLQPRFVWTRMLFVSML